MKITKLVTIAALTAFTHTQAALIKEWPMGDYFYVNADHYPNWGLHFADDITTINTSILTIFSGPLTNMVDQTFTLDSSHPQFDAASTLLTDGEEQWLYWTPPGAGSEAYWAIQEWPDGPIDLIGGTFERFEVTFHIVEHVPGEEINLIGLQVSSRFYGTRAAEVPVPDATSTGLALGAAFALLAFKRR